MNSTKEKSDLPFIKLSRIFYMILAWFFMISILVQVFFAGTAMFVTPGDWEMHRKFVNLL